MLNWPHFQSPLSESYVSYKISQSDALTYSKSVYLNKELDCQPSSSGKAGNTHEALLGNVQRREENFPSLSENAPRNLVKFPQTFSTLVQETLQIPFKYWGMILSMV